MAIPHSTRIRVMDPYTGALMVSSTTSTSLSATCGIVICVQPTLCKTLQATSLIQDSWIGDSCTTSLRNQTSLWASLLIHLTKISSTDWFCQLALMMIKLIPPAFLICNQYLRLATKETITITRSTLPTLTPTVQLTERF
jgi:hypothetical protein